jgi:hypothetical protein
VTLRDFLDPLIGVKFDNALSLVTRGFAYPGLAYIEILHNMTPHIVNLLISDSSFITTDDFTKFACSFRCLETLAVGRVVCAAIMAPSGSRLSLPDNLRVVKVSDGLMMKWLLSFQHLPPIHTIHGVEFTPGRDILSTSDLLQTLGASLETVRLTCLGMLFVISEFYSY